MGSRRGRRSGRSRNFGRYNDRNSLILSGGNRGLGLRRGRGRGGGGGGGRAPRSPPAARPDRPSCRDPVPQGNDRSPPAGEVDSPRLRDVRAVGRSNGEPVV